MVRSRIISLRRGTNFHPFSRFDGFPILKIPRGATLLISRRVRVFPRVRFTLEDSTALIQVGERTFINRNSEIVAATGVVIGSDCAISWDVLITDTDFHQVSGVQKSRSVRIGDNVWIGAGATILKGVTVGHGAIVAAKSVVTEDVPSKSLVAGNPARLIRTEVDWEL